MALSYISGKLNLQADNNGWYLIGAYIDTGIDLKTIDISQSSGVAGEDSYAIITANDSQNYKFSLVQITGDGFTGITYNVDQTATGATAHPQIQISGNNTGLYNLNLVTGEFGITIELVSGTGSVGGGGSVGNNSGGWRGIVSSGANSTVFVRYFNPFIVR